MYLEGHNYRSVIGNAVLLYNGTALLIFTALIQEAI